MKTESIVLASGSPYRKKLLKKLPLNFIVVSPDIDESVVEGENPADLAIRLARLKVQAVAEKFSDHLIIGSDQVAVLEGLQLRKPGNRENSIKQLQAASGKWVDFYTSICVLDSCSQQYRDDLDHCRVHFKTLTTRQIVNYVAIDKPFQCAGAFKSEGLGIVLFERLETEDPNALIGLPLIKLVALLRQFGIEII